MSNHVQTDGYNEEDTMVSAMMGLFFYRWANSINLTKIKLKLFIFTLIILL